MTDTAYSAGGVGRMPAAEPDAAVAFFAARMACQTDVSDVHSLLDRGDPPVTLVDTRGTAAWQHGRIPGAVHLPTDDIPHLAASLLDRSVPVVTYCWGPGCNGASRAALALSLLGYRVREMIGGLEYWIREGLPVETTDRVRRRPVDPLTGPAATVACDC